MAEAKKLLSEPRNFRMNNVELNWPKLVKSVSPFGTEQWEIQIATTDKKVADEWENNYFKVKFDKEGKKYTVNLKRKVYRADGSENKPVRVVDASVKQIDATNLGNGSMGNVLVYQYPYETAGRTGVAASLTAVQVIKFEEYTGGGEDFEVVDTSDALDEPTKRPSKKDKTPPKNVGDVVKDWSKESDD
mgnify:FL=1